MNEKQFAVVELMGHRKFGAEVSEVERFGTKMLQARILGPDVVQLVHPQAIYAVTACTEEQARRVNTEWVLRQAAPSLELPAVASSVADVDFEEGTDDQDRIDELERGIAQAISKLRYGGGTEPTIALLEALIADDPVPSAPADEVAF